MKIRIVAGLIAMSTSVLGCSAEHIMVDDVAEENPVDNMPPQSPLAEDAMTQSRSGSIVEPDSVSLLIDQSLAVGPGTTEAYEQRLSVFGASDGAALRLREFIEALPADAYTTRETAIYNLGRIPDPQSVEFLLDIALRAQVFDNAASHTGGGDSEFSLRSAAGSALVRFSLLNVAGAKKAVERILREATPTTSQVVAVELFTAGVFSDAQRGILEGRGIPANFRILTEREQIELMTVDTEADKRPGAPDSPGMAIPAVEDVIVEEAK